MPMSNSTGNIQVSVNLNHAQTEHYHANLPFAVNDFEIPGMAIFPTTTVPGTSPMRQYHQFEYPQTSMLPMSSTPAHIRSSYPGVTSGYSGLPANSMHQDVFRPVSVPAKAQPPPVITPTSTVPPGLPSFAHQGLSLQSATPFRRSKWEVENADSFTSPVWQTSIFRKYVFQEKP
jgi:hypothetical protein